MSCDATRAARCTHWQIAARRIEFGELPALMGIVNVTPDSFSDGGLHFNRQLAVDHALRLEDEGAAILDIGGESTRPGSQPVSLDEELRRVVPVLESLANRVSIPMSIDTSKSQVALAAMELGCEIINDITGLEGDPRMVEVAVQTSAGICAMHIQGTPQTMQTNPVYKNVLSEIFAYLERRDAELRRSGVDPSRICVDPGIGFGKTHQHNLDLLVAAGQFHRLGRPLLFGHSRKGFIGKLIGDKHRSRVAGTVGVSLALARQGVQILRVHDVQETRDALICFAAIGGFANIYA